MTSGDRCEFCRLLEAGSSETSVAFLDRSPLFHGHCLLVPRQHHETLSDLPSDLLPSLFADVQLLSRAVEQAMEAEGSFVAINNRVSQSVPHLHVHVIPRRRGYGLRGFFWPRKKYEQDQEQAVAARIREAVSGLQA